MSAVVRFERIGRNRNVPDMPIEGDPDDHQAIAEQVYRVARRHLMSSDYEVTVTDRDNALHVSIGFGRYGQGKVIQA